MKSLFEKERPWKNDAEAIEWKQEYFKKNWKERYAYLLTFFLIGLGFFTRYRISLLLALLLLLSLMTKKYVAATSRGFETFSNMLIMTNHRIWTWEDIDTITYDKVPDHPDRALFYFTKGDVTRRGVFPSSERRRVLKLAQKYRPDVKIYNGAEFREQVTKKYGRRTK